LSLIAREEKMWQAAKPTVFLAAVIESSKNISTR